MWCVLISYYPEIARIIKNDPRVFVELSFICTNMGLKEIKANKEKIMDVKRSGGNLDLSNTRMSRNDVSIGTLESIDMITTRYEDAYYLFRSYGMNNAFEYSLPQDPHEKIEKFYKDFMLILGEILFQSGMTGI